jgi:hypothetical protein
VVANDEEDGNEDSQPVNAEADVEPVDCFQVMSF